MRLVIQRVNEASVKVSGQVVGDIGSGLLIFLAVAKEDVPDDVECLVRKIIELRIFEDDAGKMNRAAWEVKAAFLVVSQFTLLGDCRGGRRPSFDGAADPILAKTLYELFVERLRALSGCKVATGEFRAMMDVSLVNSGPVTFILES